MVKIWRRLFTGDGVAFPEALGRSIDASGKTAEDLAASPTSIPRGLRSCSQAGRRRSTSLPSDAWPRRFTSRRLGLSQKQSSTASLGRCPLGRARRCGGIRRWSGSQAKRPPRGPRSPKSGGARGRSRSAPDRSGWHSAVRSSPETAPFLAPFAGRSDLGPEAQLGQTRARMLRPGRQQSFLALAAGQVGDLLIDPARQILQLREVQRVQINVSHVRCSTISSGWGEYAGGVGQILTAKSASDAHTFPDRILILTGFFSTIARLDASRLSFNQRFFKSNAELDATEFAGTVTKGAAQNQRSLPLYA